MRAEMRGEPMLSKYSVKRPYTVLVGVVLVLVLGYVSFTSMQTDLLPDMTLPYAIVYTMYPGASPEEVESIVTRPVEQSMATISNIENISSVSSENISFVILEFSQSANMDAVTIEMRESLDQIEGYWDDSIGSPIIMKLNPDMLPVMVSALEAGDLTQSELTDLVNNEILPELESIEGVASVSASGLIEENVQVVLREDKIRAVNQKVKRALDGKFEEAESELEENQRKLEEGQEKLESGQEELANQTSQAESQINSGSSQLISGQLQLEQKLSEIEAGLTKLDDSAKELDQKESELLEGEQALAKLPEQRAALETQKTQLDAAISQLEAAPQQLAALDAQLAILDAQLEVLKQQLAALQGGGASGGGETGGTSGGSEMGGTSGEAAGGSQEQTGRAMDGALSLDDSMASGEAEISGDASAAEVVPQEAVKTGNAEKSSALIPQESVKTGSAEEGDMILPEDETGAETSAPGGDGGTGSVTPGGITIEDITDILTQIGGGELPDGGALPDIGELPGGSEIQDQIAATEAELQAQIAAKQAERDTYANVRAQALTALAAAGVNTSGDTTAIIGSIGSVKAELVTRRVQLADGLAQMDETLAQSSAQQEQIALGKLAIADGRKQLSEGRAQLEAAKKQLQSAQKKIASGQSSLPEALAQLNSAKINATIEMAVGKAELKEGQKQLDAALEQIRDQKEAAYDQADVTEIITAEMIKGILAAQNFSMPAGYVSEDGVDFLVRVGNKFDTTEALSELELLDLHMDDLDPILLGDVADVVVVDNSDEVYAKINGHSGVMFSMQKQSGYSTGVVSERIKERFAKLEEQKGVSFLNMMDQGIYIDLVVDSVIDNMLSGAVLAVLILLLFLRSARPTLVIACSIPISIMAAVVMMYFSGINLNIISLSGLALGIGMLVDNSIVVIENIYRLRGEGMPARKAAVEGARQVAGAIAASTLTTVCVFLPIVFTEGITRQLFVDMGLTIGYSLLASLVVALTLVPAMGAGLLKKAKERPSRVIGALQNGYAWLLRVSLHVKPLVVLLAVGMLVLSAYLSVSKGTAFMPEMESTQVSVSLQMPEGSTFADTAAMSDVVLERIAGVQDVTDVGAMIGGGGVMGAMGGGSGEDAVSMYVLLDENRTISNEALAAEIRDRTKDLDCELAIETSSMDMSSLGGSGISIHITGRDLDRLKTMAGEVAALVEGVEGTKNVSDGIAEKTLEQRIVVDKNKAMGYQLTTAQIFQFLQQKLADASSATTLSTLSKDYSVLVVSDTDEALTRDKIKKLKITGKDEENQDVDIPLSKLVEFQDTEGFSSINREAQMRYVNVTAELADGFNIGLVAAEVEKALDGYEVPDGYSLSMAGEDETINEAMEQVVKMLLLAVLFMYLIMVAQFQSLLSPFIIIFTIPLAFTGGFFGLYLTNSPVSVIAMIGFVMLSGIIVNNGIVLVDTINQLREGGMEKREAIVEAGRSRLRPILMTALTTILGLTTMAMGRGMGADMVQPMAIVTIGGLTYGTLLTLFVIPCIYDLLNRRKSVRGRELEED